ncbi:histone-lysine N-methyltransferase, H3 lysine-9 specific SUVH1-like [Cucurbita pepo subsp. pepo]|uniref:histone-lysine N-methyltransferase, H3 lysine-9 specific SUVH1-like n=1 Tax=Cucurbita pepo subsp. pepo TaxID=3664 RepID=UPI000C9D9DC5|nr:histone-lysine N-methyltransferase, H3 lysine-9 specific SUVH1-like [Cucurbita pepo subsp. pepo]XP_023517587.1 histone-lysine N-methyltransferase, H3 lysine-9 specific SUVH1-like [Cucurbita pepo subsp. pepo]
MEQPLGQDPIPVAGSLDKSKVLNVRPLRQLVPVFPSASNVSSFSTPQGAAPFVCAGPSGPFPPGVAPFYPFFFSPNEQSQQTPGGTTNTNASFGLNSPISTAVPISSFRTPTEGTSAQNTGSSRKNSRRRAQLQDGYSDGQNDNSQYYGIRANDGEDSSKSGRKNKSKKKTRNGQDINFMSDVDIDAMLNDMVSTYNLSVLDSNRQAHGNIEAVSCVLMVFDLLRRKISQVEESKESTPGNIRRPDLKAGAFLMTKGVRTNSNKRVGTVPGVEIGDIFFFRMELCLVGLHAPSMAGIDYMGLKVSQDEEPVAVSIVSSGGYEDDTNDADVLIYSGQGGVNRKDKESTDQKLERGNLALEKSLHRGNEVRVVRGVRDFSNPTGKIYVYDGLYKIQESWVEKGKSGCNVFKYKLVRLPGQREAFLTWKLVQQWKDGNASRIGVIIPDLASGAESLPVSLVNDVDDEKGPAYFTYYAGLKYLKPVCSTEPSAGCNCIGGCLPGNLNCPCMQKNGGYLPYSSNGVLASQQSMIYECGASCQCPPNCRNRVSQGGLKFRLEVFRTKGKGWGLRSWDPIRAGAYICQYAGEVIDSSKEKDSVGDNEDSYVFDAKRSCPNLEVLSGDSDGPPRLPFPLVISAKNVGNVARFMNHSCSPNVYWKPILRENKSEHDVHIAFHAIRHVPPMMELTYDYGIVPPESANGRKIDCLCESLKCRGYFC